jgi:hypothetical protein
MIVYTTTKERKVVLIKYTGSANFELLGKTFQLMYFSTYFNQEFYYINPCFNIHSYFRIFFR